MKIIRASEIGTYQFCHRAWWYQQQGFEPDNKLEIAFGNEMHENHARMVQRGNCLQFIAYVSLLLAVLIIVVWLVQLII